MNFASDVLDAQMMNYNDFGNLFSFHLALSTGQNSYDQLNMIGYDRWSWTRSHSHVNILLNTVLCLSRLRIPCLCFYWKCFLGEVQWKDIVTQTGKYYSKKLVFSDRENSLSPFSNSRFALGKALFTAMKTRNDKATKNSLNKGQMWACNMSKNNTQHT